MACVSSRMASAGRPARLYAPPSAAAILGKKIGRFASWQISAFTPAGWKGDGTPVWTLPTEEGNLMPARVEVVLVLSGHGRIRLT